MPKNNYFFILSFFLIFLIISGPVKGREKLFNQAAAMVEQTLGYKFSSDLRLQTQTDTEFKIYLRREMKRLFAPGEFKHLQKIFSSLGFIPRNYNLKKKFIDFYSTQAGSYYDPRTKTIKELKGDLPEKARLFVYLHELVHAYQDHRYNLGSLQRHLNQPHNLDARLNFNFLVEGHANLVALAALSRTRLDDKTTLRNSSLVRIVKLMSNLLKMDFRSLLSYVEEKTLEANQISGQALTQLKELPPFIFRMMLDPYILGQKIWLERAAEKGWFAAESWLENPPRTLRQFFYSPPGTKSFSDRSGFSHPVEKSPLLTEGVRLGIYPLLFWLDSPITRPEWGGNLITDQAYWHSTDDSGVVCWRLKFSDSSTISNFLRLLFQKVEKKRASGQITKTSTTHANNSSLEYQITGKTRHFHCLQKNKQVVLISSPAPFKLTSVIPAIFKNYNICSGAKK